MKIMGIKVFLIMNTTLHLAALLYSDIISVTTFL